MPTERKMATKEEQLDDWQLIQRMRTATSRMEEVTNRPAQWEQTRESRDRAPYRDLLYGYFDALWTIARNTLVLRVRNRLKHLSADEMDKVIRAWSSETDGSLNRELERIYLYVAKSELLQEEIEQSRTDIAVKVNAIRNGFRVFKWDENDELWPLLATDGDVVIAAPPARAKIAAAAQKRAGPNFSQFIESIISQLVAQNVDVSSENAAALIRVGDPNVLALLPKQFRLQIRARRSTGNLLEFIELEEKENSPIDFRRRFERNFSKAKREREKRIEAEAKSER